MIPWTKGAKSSKEGYPSDGLAPTNDCTTKKLQSLTFHPDKNTTCMEQATEKMKVLNNKCP
jgi:hypothetical protein